MDDGILTNSSLLKYWQLVRGTAKTKLTIMEVMSLGVHVTFFDVMPRGESGFHWTDSLVDIELNGNLYTSFPDIISGSLPSFSEAKGINNDAISFKVSNVNPSVRALAFGGKFKDAQMNVTLVILNPYDSKPLYSVRMFTGFIDYVTASVDPNQKTNDMEIHVNSVYKKLDRQAALIAANAVYQSYFPSDEYFSLLGQINQSQTWRYK
ncbi:DUF2163 domain-containing protein [Pseudescherichia sp.]|uniref:DUF2163 domain-containing protein n=1 Tax=Pseudescherichia sp. TaxID=2055881 RepID=UPI0028A196E8|nr:DUF2163 domain-containing protein [Pseudescherichia sp.]